MRKIVKRAIATLLAAMLSLQGMTVPAESFEDTGEQIFVPESGAVDTGWDTQEVMEEVESAGDDLAFSDEADASLLFEAQPWEEPLSEEEIDFQKDYDLEEEGPILVGASPQIADFLARPEIQEIITNFRKNMVSRKKTMEETFSLTGADAILLSQEDLNALSDALIEELYSETGVSTEGDYLHYHVRHAAIRINARKSNGLVTYVLTMECTYNSSAEEEELLSYHINIVRENLKLDLLESDYEKLRLIYTFIAGFVKYDWPHFPDQSYLTQYTAYAALVKGTSVCQGISLLIKRFLTDLGIENRVVVGYLAGGRHMWNLVKIGEKYYHCDATQDLGKGEANFKYFLVGEETISKDHVRRDHCAEEPFLSDYPASAYDYGSEKDIEGVRSPLTMEAGDTAHGFLVTGLEGDINLGGEDYSFTVNGAGADHTYGKELLFGDWKWSPIGWSFAGENEIYDIPREEACVSSRTYTLPYKAVTKPGKKEILLAFHRYLWDGEDWVTEGEGDDEISFVSVPITIASLNDEGAKVNLSQTKITLYRGAEKEHSQVNLKPQVTGVGGSFTLKYSSSDKSVAKVTSAGVVKAVSKGSATITVKVVKDKKTLCKTKLKVTVKKPSLKASALTLKKGNSGTLSVKVTPAGKITYQSADSSIATVTEQGVVTGISRGNTTISLSCHGLTVKVKVKVK